MRAIWPGHDVDCYLHLSPVLGMSGDIQLCCCHVPSWHGQGQHTLFYPNSFQFLHNFMELVTVFLRHVKNIMTCT